MNSNSSPLKIHNFLFHRVNPIRDPQWDPIDPELFRKYLHYITKHFEVILMEDIIKLDLTRKNRPLAAISFDDGYLDNYEFALPILEEFSCKASFYVVTDCIEHNIPTWTFETDYRIYHTNATKVNFDFNFLDDEKLNLNLIDSEARLSGSQILKRTMKRLSANQQHVLLESLRHQTAEIDLPVIMMNWDQLKEMRTLGHYIGSHGKTHAMLGQFSSEEEVYYELSESSKKINNQLGYKPLSIAYPIGSYNENVKKIAISIGYSFGLAVKNKVYDRNLDGQMEIPRIELYNESWFKSKARMNGSLLWLKQLINRA